MTSQSEALAAQRGSGPGDQELANIYEIYYYIQRRRRDPRSTEYRVRMHPPWRDASTFVRDIIDEIGYRPPLHVIERIDPKKGYEPGNVEWVQTGRKSI